jgi:putative ABC transport system permease protein
VAPVLRLGGSLSTVDHEPIDVIVEAIDLDNEVWVPTFVEGQLGGDRAGLVLARKAADDLGVTVGDVVVLTHPARQGDGFAVVGTPMPVAAIHPSPFRFSAYLDRSQLGALGLPGLANAAYLLPASGSNTDDVERELFSLPGVTSVQPVAVSQQVVQDSLEDFVGVIRVIEVFILVLALLIAYNATSINADERARERATLFAFGMPVRRALALETAEGLLIGLLGTAVGVGAGLLVNQWIVAYTWSTTMPELGLDIVLTGRTALTAVAFGVLAVGVAPLLTARRLRRMDVPGALRVVE